MTKSTTTYGRAGASAHAGYARARSHAASRRRARDAVVMIGLGLLPAATFVLTRYGASGIEAVGIAVFAALLLLGWRRGAAAADEYDAGAWLVGARGEERTAAVVEKAVDRASIVFHDVRPPGRRENIDHLVIGRAGVLLIESKRWSGTVVVGRTVRVNGRPRREVADQLRRLREITSRELAAAPVEAFVCIHGARVRPAWFRRRATIDGVAYGGPRELERWLRRRRRCASRHEVDEWAAAIDLWGLERAPAGR